MPNFSQLLDAHTTALVLDAASTRVQVGIWQGTQARWATSEEEAGLGLFRCLESLGADPAAVGAYVFCSGPGSILGIRTVAMAVRVWRTGRAAPVYGYSSLALVSQALGLGETAVIVDARRQSWHVYRQSAGLTRESSATLGGERVTPAGFRHWTPLPPGTGEVSYTLAELLPRAALADLFTVMAEPDAVLAAEPSYALWTPSPHRA